MDICNGSLFWDTNKTWYSSWPEFTECFQYTVLVWIPCGWLWLTTPFYLYYLVGASGTTCSLYKLYTVKLVTCGVLAIISAVQLVQTVLFSSETMIANTIAPSLQIVTFILAMLLMYMERRKGFITSGVLFIYWLLLAVTGVVPFYSKIIQKSYQADLVDFSSFYAQYSLVLVQLLLSCFPEQKDMQVDCPEVSSSFPSRITFAWVTRLILKGYKKVLDETDIAGLHPRDATVKNVSHFMSSWTKQPTTPSDRNLIRKTTSKQQRRHLNIQSDEPDEDERSPLLQKQKEYTNRAKQAKDASLLKALLKSLWFDMIRSQIWKLFYDLLYFTNPLLLGELILFTEDRSSPAWKGYTLSAIMFSSILTQSVFYHATWHHSTSVALRIRAVLISAIYRKALTMSSSAKSESSSGEVVNLMSVDCEHIKNTAQWVWATWSSLFQVVLSLYLLYTTLGLPMLAGLGVMLMLVPFNYLLTSKWQKYQVELMKSKDSRMKMIGEVLNAMKIIKLYAWEPFFEERIADIRDKEIHFLWKISLLEAFGIFTWALSPYLVSFATLLAYVYATESHYLDAHTAFVAVALLNNMGYAVNALPEVLSACVQAYVSLNRISKYLNSEDIANEQLEADTDEDNIVSIQNATFAWNDGENESPHLKNINLNIKRGALVAIIGQVGEGKSSLLSSILGELHRMSGTFNCKGSIAYVPQQAWIQNDTLQKNILFGKDLDSQLYNNVLDCCALLPDLAILPAGDQTEIGERGINLSGGQKQRVSLARAVYNDADIYLLDDPLSAVDSHVGKHIFEELLSRNGLLQNKTRILVTHGVQWLSRVDMIVVMSGGRIDVTGTYSQLQKRSSSFSNYSQHCLRNDGGSDSEDLHGQSNESDGANTNDFVDTSMDVNHDESIDVGNTGQLIDEEFTEEGKVTWSVYATYVTAIGTKVLIVCGLIYACYQVASVVASILLSKWTDNTELANFTLLPANSSSRQDINNYYLGLYGGLGVVQSVCMVVFAILWASRTVRASRSLHFGMVASVLRAPMAFFDTTPTGRVINRFSQDIDTIDLRMQHLLQFAFNTIFVVLSCFIVISYSTPIFIVIFLPVCFIYYCVQVLYIKTSRQLKRLESKTRSPIYSHFSETLAGVSVIRAMKQQDRFIKESESRVDENQRYIYYGFTAQRWLGFRLETLGNFIILAASMIAVASRDTLSGGIMGLTVSYALQITQNLYYVVKMISELETQAVSVERVKQYTDIAPEAPWFTSECPLSSAWPWNGEVIFRNYSTRYRPELDLILNDVSCTITSGEKVGVVGRTGAGKSSLTLSLFRLIEAAGGEITTFRSTYSFLRQVGVVGRTGAGKSSLTLSLFRLIEAAGGEINIDGLDISSLGLHDLRRRLTILPQEPILFSGSLRDNVDPFNHHSDSEIWTALDHAHLKPFVMTLPAGLQHECSEGGENISMGQRQLLCLARALLRKTKILVLDEATAAVDMETDDLIQQTIRSEFKDCTVLTIAHRLNTVMDYDRILILENGRLAESGPPGMLLKRANSIFCGMAKSAGIKL